MINLFKKNRDKNFPFYLNKGTKGKEGNEGKVLQSFLKMGFNSASAEIIRTFHT